MKGFKWTGWIKPQNAKPSEHMTVITFDMPKVDRNQCEYEKEIAIMVKAYREMYPALASGFLVGSSLVGNKGGDSQRFHELKALCDKECHG